jgi:S-adenosylmethionine:tRNA-ribosyltransferase-isomerase (queuine synthetase)
VAVGTSVVRALESAWDETRGRLRPATRLATLRVGPSFVPRVVDGSETRA